MLLAPGGYSFSEADVGLAAETARSRRAETVRSCRVAAIIPHRPPLAFLADSGGRLRVSLTARSQWHSRRRRYWKTMQVLLASAVAVSGSFNGECDAKC
jgi:hypothetical protein